MRGPASLTVNAWSYVEWLSRSRLTVCWSEWTRWRPGQADLRSNPPECPIDAWGRDGSRERGGHQSVPRMFLTGVLMLPLHAVACRCMPLHAVACRCWMPHKSTALIVFRCLQNNVTCRPPANNLMPYRSSRLPGCRQKYFWYSCHEFSQSQETLQNISSPEDFVNFMQQEGMSNEDIQRTARRPSWNRCPIVTCEYCGDKFLDIDIIGHFWVWPVYASMASWAFSGTPIYAHAQMAATETRLETLEHMI